MTSASLESPLNFSAPERGRIATWITFAIVALVAGVLFARVIADLVADWWNEPNLSQGLLIPPVALYFAWLDHSKVLAARAAPNGKGLWIVMAGCLTFLTGKLAAEFFLQRISMIIVLIGLIVFWWGRERLARLAFPLALLATMIPLPAIVYNTASAPLQLLASSIATTIAQWFHVSVFRDGNIIQLATISLGVDEACSGLSSLSALCVGALLLSRFLCERMPARCIVILLAVPVSILVNVVRVSGTAILADYDERFALGFYHLFAGWLVFVLGLLAFIGIAKAAHAVLER